MKFINKIKDLLNIRKEVRESNESILQLYDQITGLKNDIKQLKLDLSNEKNKADKLMEEQRKQSDKWD